MDSKLNIAEEATIKLAQDIFNSYQQQLRLVSTLEEQLRLENVIRSKVDDINKEFKLSYVVPGTTIDISDFKFWENVKEELLKLVSMVSFSFRRLLESEQILDTNLKQFKKLEVDIQQKIAWLKYLDGSGIQYAFTEVFRNKSNLDFAKENTLNFDNNQELATLPVTKQTEVKASSVVLGNKSNGAAGSDDATETNDYLADNLLSKDGYFIYTSKGVDKTLLDLDFIFDREIINGCDIYPYLLDTKFQRFDLIEVTLYTDTETIELSKVINFEPISISSLDEKVKILFPPARVNKINLIFETLSRQDYESNILTSSISLDRVVFNKYSYNNTGIYNTKKINYPSGLYLANMNLSVYPEIEDLYDLSTIITFNDSQYVDENEYFLNGIGGVFEARLLLEKNDNVLAKLSSFYSSESRQTIDTFTHGFNYLLNPSRINYTKAIDSSKIVAYHPEVLKISSYDFKTLGYVSSGSSRIAIPISLINVEPEDIEVMLNGIIQSYTIETPVAGEWSLSENGRYIEFSSLTPTNNKVEIRLFAEECNFTYREGYYYYYPSLDFDPDKTKISLKAYSPSLQNYNYTLPSDVTRIVLDHQDIDELTLFSSNGTTYTEVATRALVTSAGKYYVNYKEGIIWLYEAFDEDTVRASITGHVILDIQPEDYEVVFSKENKKAIAIRIEANKLSAIEASDIIAAALSPFASIKAGKRTTRATGITPANPRKKALTFSLVIPGSLYVTNLFDNDSTPEEVEYLDGISEFLGLKEVKEELTNETEPSAGIVSFSVNHSETYYATYGVNFRDKNVFANLKNSLASVVSSGDYYISEDGLVSVYTGSDNLEGSIAYSYYYKLPDYYPDNKYSVDYQKGIIYGGSDFKSTGKVHYKAAQYLMEYDAVVYAGIQNIDTQSKTIDVLSNYNSNLIKFAWEIVSEKDSLYELAEYYSPLLNRFALGFY